MNENVILNDYDYLRSECTSSTPNLVWLPVFEQYLDMYQKVKDIDQESLALLGLANWIEERVTDDHSFCLKYKTKEEVALVWIMDTVYGIKWNGEAFV